MGSFSIWHWLVVFLLLPLIYVPMIFYILAMRRAFLAVDEDFRPIEPNLVWLDLIPIFNLVWIFFLVVYLSKAYRKMWEANKLTKETSVGYGFGLSFAICGVLSLVPMLNILVLIPLLVFWILHWIQVHKAPKLVLRLDRDIKNVGSSVGQVVNL